MAGAILVASASFIWIRQRNIINEELIDAGTRPQEAYFLSLASRVTSAAAAMERVATEVAGDQQILALLTEAQQVLAEEGGGRGGERSAAIRERLREYLVERWARVARIYDVRYLNVYLGTDLTAFFRLQQTDWFGDSVAGKLEVVRAVAESHHSRSGFEVGPDFVGLRAAAPVMTSLNDKPDKNLVGLLEVGIGLDPFMTALSKDLGVQSAILVSRAHMARRMAVERIPDEAGRPWAGVFVLAATTDPVIEKFYTKPAANALIQQVAAMTDRFGPSSGVLVWRGHTPYVVIAHPLRDFAALENAAREPVGVMVTWAPVAELQAINARALHTGVVYGSTGIAVILASLYFVWRYAVGRLERVVIERTRQLETAHRELVLAEQRYRGLFENAIQGMFQSTLEGRFRSANPAMARILGFPSAMQLLGIRDLAAQLYFHPQDRESWVNRLLAEGELKNHEVRMMHKSGRPIWVQMNVRLTRAEDGATVIEGLLLDHTARKEADERLVESERRYRQIVETAGDGFMMLDLDNVIREVNDAALRVIGLPREELLSQHVERFVGEWPASAVQAGKDGVRFEVVFRRPAGGRVPILVSLSPLRDASSMIVGRLAFLTDLSDLKKAQRELVKAERRYRGIFQNAVQGMFQCTLDGRLINANQAYIDAFGYDTLEELKAAGDHWAIWSQDDEDHDRMARDLMQRGALRNLEQSLTARDGSIRVALANLWLARESEGEEPFVEGIILDITAEKKAEEALITARQAAEAANRAKSGFMEAFSREIRAPLNAIIGLTDLSLESPMTTEQKGNMEVIKASARHILAVVADVLDLSRIESGKIELEPLEIDLVEFLDSLGRSFAEAADRQGLALDLHKDPDLQGRVIVDGLRLRQVLVNLVDNALRHTKEGGVRIVVAPGDPVEREIRFTVRDSGPGIAEERIPDLFAGFDRPAASFRLAGGTGLGLAVSRRLVEKMGGRIWVESRIGEGSAFHFTILAKPGEAVLAASSMAEAGGPELALVLDADMETRRVLASFLDRLGFAVAETAEIGEAFRLAERPGIGVVLMDLDGPDGAGVEGAAGIREILGRSGARAPILALAALERMESFDAWRTTGVTDYLVKPVDFYDLAALIDRYAPQGLIMDTAPESEADPLLDTQGALRRFGGDGGLLAELTTAFAGKLPKRIRSLKDALEEEDFDRLVLEAHLLKGAAATVGAQRCGRQAAGLEKAAQARDHEWAALMLDRLKTDAGPLLTRIPANGAIGS